MNLIADESVDRQIVDRLRQDGYQVYYVAEMDPGISDDVVLSLANQKGAMLLTADKDFGELIFRQRRASPGIVLVRLAGLSQARKAEMVAAAIAEYGTELSQAFVVITPGFIRIRRVTYIEEDHSFGIETHGS